MEKEKNKKEHKCFYKYPVIILMTLIIILIGTGLSIVFIKINDLPESFIISYVMIWLVLAAICICALIFFIFTHNWAIKKKTPIDTALEEEILRVIKEKQESKE